MIIQPLEASDLEIIRELQPADWSDIIPIHNYYLNSSFCNPIKIIDNNKIIGIGTSINHADVVWLAHIIVHRDKRNNGIGGLITKYLVDTGWKTGLETICLLATELGTPVYSKLGFETETTYTFYKNENAIIESIMDPNIFQFNEIYKDDILNLDAWASGENRVMRMDEYLSESYIYIHNNELEGFYIPGLGEGLIIANNPIAGIALMKLRLNSNKISILPDDNSNGSEFLLQNGYTAFRTAKRMRLGKPRIWQPSGIYNRVSGQIG